MSNGIIIESAPFVMHSILLSGDLTMTDILFLVEVNSITLSSSYISCFPVEVLLISIILLESLLLNTTPKYLAAFAKASSSGEDALY